MRFSDIAQGDLDYIQLYYQAISDRALGKVNADIFDTLDRLRVFPHSGTPLDEVGLSRSVTHKYRYVIWHTVENDCLVVEAIFRNQNR